MPETHDISVGPDEAGVTFARELTQAERRAVADAIEGTLARLDAVAESLAHPVHLKKPVIEEPDLTGPDLDEDGQPIPGTGGKPIELGGIVQVTRRLSPEAERCPDCSRPTVAGNDPAVGFDFLACSNVLMPLPKEDWPCHPGCMVACGVTGA